MPLLGKAPTLRLGRLQYRAASWLDWVNVLVRQLYDFMYRNRVSREEVVEWLRQYLPKLSRTGALDTSFVSDILLDQFASAISSLDIPVELFLNALVKKLFNNLPAGYRWELNADGMHYIKKQHGGPPTTERPVAVGKKFVDQVFIGAWWHTDAPTSGATRQLQSALRKGSGGVFYKLKNSVGVTEYFGYAIVPADEAPLLGQLLDGLGKQLLAEGPTRDFRLSAARLDGLAERRPIRGDDVYTLSGIFRSEKFNWEFNLPDLLNGRHKGKNQDVVQAVKMILKEFEV